MRGAAGIALEMMPVDSLRAAIERKLSGASAKQKVVLLRLLARYGDVTTQDIFTRMARDDEAAVRLEAIAALEHSAIVPLYDFGEEEGQPYFVMRFMHGGSLLDRIRQGQLSVEESIPIVDRMAAALA